MFLSSVCNLPQSYFNEETFLFSQYCQIQNDLGQCPPLFHHNQARASSIKDVWTLLSLRGPNRLKSRWRSPAYYPTHKVRILTKVGIQGNCWNSKCGPKCWRWCQEALVQSGHDAWFVVLNLELWWCGVLTSDHCTAAPETDMWGMRFSLSWSFIKCRRWRLSCFLLSRMTMIFFFLDHCSSPTG